VGAAAAGATTAINSGTSQRQRRQLSEGMEDDDDDDDNDDDDECWERAAYSTNGDSGDDGDMPPTCNSDHLMCMKGSRGILCGSCEVCKLKRFEGICVIFFSNIFYAKMPTAVVAIFFIFFVNHSNLHDDLQNFIYMFHYYFIYLSSCF
jgi:hypothetical protein